MVLYIEKTAISCFWHYFRSIFGNSWPFVETLGDPKAQIIERKLIINIPNLISHDDALFKQGSIVLIATYVKLIAMFGHFHDLLLKIQFSGLL